MLNIKKNKKQIMILFIIMIALFAFADKKGEEIAKKSFELKEPLDMTANTKMILVDKNGNKQLRVLNISSKKGQYGTNSFIEFVEPADVKGTKFLTLVEENGENVQRLYLPALKKIRRISSSNKDGKFMGSDLCYYDMEDHDYEDYTYEYVSENQIIDGKAFEGMKFYVIKMIPKDSDSPYSYTLTWINMDNYFQYKVVPYDKKGNVEKNIFMMSVKEMNGVFIPEKTLVINDKDNHKTLLTQEGIKINTGLKDNIFEIQNLK